MTDEKEGPRLWGCYCYDTAGTVRRDGKCPHKTEACYNGKGILEERLTDTAEQRAIDYERTKSRLHLYQMQHRLCEEDFDYRAVLMNDVKRMSAKRIG